MTETRLPFFGVVRVTGEERAVFLHHQLSNDVLHLDENHAAYATYNTPQGRVIADLLVVVRAQDVCLVMAADLVDKVMRRLRLFVLRSKVVLTADNDLGVAGLLADDVAVSGLPDTPPLRLPAHTENGVTRVTLPHGGYILLAEKTRLPADDVAGEERWRRHEIACGYPHIAAATTESCVAQMLNQHRLGGVHFKKGCYPGQEIIARAQYRGQVRRGLAVYRGGEVLPPGTKIYDETDTEAGMVLDSVTDGGGSLNLCVIKHAVAGKAVRARHGALHLQTLFFQKKETT